MKKVYLVFVIIVLTAGLNAQVNMDSLWGVWSDEKQCDTCRLKAINLYIYDGYLVENYPDTAIILAKQMFDFAEEAGSKYWMSKALNHIGGCYETNRDDRAIEYYNKCLKINEEINNKQGIADAYFNIGNYYDKTARYPKAINYMNRSQEIYKEIGDKMGIAQCLMLNASISSKLGDEAKTIDYYKRALEIFEEQKNMDACAAIYGSIGNIYLGQSDYSKALEYYDQCLIILEELDNQINKAAVLSNIGNIHLERGDYSEALNYYYQSLDIYEGINNKQGKAIILLSIGRVYKLQYNYSKALDYYNQSLEISEENNFIDQKAYCLKQIGIIQLEQNSFGDAVKYCKDAFNIFFNTGYIEMQQDACHCLYEAYRSLNNNDSAIVYLEKMVIFEDSLKKTETAKKLQQMEFEKQMLADSLIQVEEKQKIQHAHELEIHKKNRARNIYIGIGLLVVIIAISLYSRLRYTRKSKAIIEKEKDKSDNLLLNILPSEIAEELKEKGSADARDFKMISILFTDFCDFTKTSSNLSASELVEEINICYKSFDQIVDKYGIEKIKTIGDAYMAAGGLPVPSDDSVKNTVMAAIEMQDFIAKRKAEMDSQGLPAFEMRVGIHTGPVVAGIVGVKKFQYDVWGDTVNTASRMESNGEVGKVNISQDTYELIKDSPEFTFESRGIIEVKGKGEMKMYFVNQSLGQG